MGSWSKSNSARLVGCDCDPSQYWAQVSGPNQPIFLLPKQKLNHSGTSTGFRPYTGPRQFVWLWSLHPMAFLHRKRARRRGCAAQAKRITRTRLSKYAMRACCVVGRFESCCVARSSDSGPQTDPSTHTHRRFFSRSRLSGVWLWKYNKRSWRGRRTTFWG